MMRTRARKRVCMYLIGVCSMCSLVWLMMIFRSTQIVNSRLIQGHPVGHLPLIKIVEEHHEVIPHWIREIKESPLEKYTIIHIDAHSDNALPEMVRDFPLGRLPNDVYEEKSMMQANDRFIISAALTGKIERVIWIYPYWASTDIYQEANFSIGVHSKGKDFCICEITTIKRICYIMDYSKDDVEDPIKEISFDSCSSNITFINEEVKDIYAQTRLQSEKNWIPPNTPLILDIDEDFFGVELPTQSLAPVGLKFNDLRPLQRNIHKLFCPTTVEMETAANKWFQNLLTKMAAARCKENPKSSFCNSFDEAYRQLFVQFRMSEIGAQMSCNPHLSHSVDVESRQIFQKIWQFLLRLNPVQLKTLSEFGLCLQSSLLAYLDSKTSLGICFGSNHVNDSMVDEHPLRAEEFTQQVDRVESIISMLSRPRLITIARSSRDGYVPRQWQQKIEDELLTRLTNRFKLTSKNVIYDDYLFGSVKGWASLVNKTVS